ncbi:TRAP transporter small permease [Thioclava sp. BHET1]|uniref:TRAP transporter small permease protein n=1 Tax=Thioclava dalianensis TaxID=1185766 RepID=A0A074TFL9_9RHOB|nr:TRAP transporter small permease [Thioclava dalianensis]KEP68950.1 C4-dicarboxylate ABC transporter permease [Thioclava dalianensis]TMV91863.1 TRAP transporter small permease [Thioclava sp. BHET1]SFN73997.1 TRAP-type C4-dicarboxylate transport system, small permease component [Thioclava dalianensis]
MTRILNTVELAVGIILLATITFLVFIAAVMRFFGHPLIWSVDLAQLLFIWLCFVGATRAMRQRVHLGVDFLVRLLPHRARLWLESALYLVFCAFLLALTVEGYKLTMMNMQRKFGDSGLPYAWVTIAVPVGSVLLIIAMTQNLISAWRGRDREGTLVFTSHSSEGEI